MSKTSYQNRQKRNMAILDLKCQDIERRFPDGKIEIDREGTIKGLSPITILAIPSELRSNGKSPSRDIKIRTYDKAGEGAKLIREDVVRTQGRVKDIDELLNERLGVELAKSEDDEPAYPGAPRGVNLPHVDEEEENIANPEADNEPERPKAIEGDDLGKVVRRPVKKQTKLPADNLKEAAEIARQLLGK